ncbi:ribonuclease P protein component ['Camptotheca acuminata' phytoplasma]|uniref:ribonuclease P protein component n=1 Tax='Camptotheca acuminata' phytoplasma TaxID=3239192 RepID=UPI00351AACC1
MKKKFICNKKEIDLIFKFKKKVKNYFFILYFFKNENLENFKFALSISKKYGKAHERNLIKRRIRMIIYNNISFISKNILFILVIKPAAKELDFVNLEKKFLVLIQKTFY